MTLPHWYLLVCGWLIAGAALCGLMCGFLYALDLAFIALWKYLGIYNVVFDAIWKYGREKAKREEAPDGQV